jgi:NADH:ubiquinone oxidoreductase subunit D
VSELDAKYPGVEAVWRREVDPCRRNALRLEIYDRSKYLFRWNACIERERQMIETETLAQTPVHADQSAFEMEDRFATFREVMERGSASLGFCYDKIMPARGNFLFFVISTSSPASVLRIGNFAM